MITKYLTFLGLLWVAYQLGKQRTKPNVTISQKAVGGGNCQTINIKL